MASDVPLDGARLGDRWVVRHRLPDGSATDVIGWLEAVDATSVRLSVVGGAVRGDRAGRDRGGSPRSGRRGRPASSPNQRRGPGTPCPAGLAGRCTSHSANGRCDPPAASPAAPTPASPWAIRACRSPMPRSGSSPTPRQHGIAPMAQVITGSEPDLALRAARLDRHLRTDRRAGGPARRTARAIDRPTIASRCTRRSMLDWWQAYQRSRPNSADQTSAADDLGRATRREPSPRSMIIATRTRRHRDRPRPPQRRLARSGVDLDPRRASAAGLGDQDDHRTRSLGCAAGRPVRLPAGRLSQRARPSPPTSASASPATTATTIWVLPR